MDGRRLEVARTAINQAWSRHESRVAMYMGDRPIYRHKRPELESGERECEKGKKRGPEKS